MAKKKKAKKKVHRRRSAQSVQTAAATGAVAGSPALPTAAPGRPATVPVVAAAGTEAARWSYMGGDVRRIGIMAGSCVVAELALWYLFSYTGLGAAVYGLIK
jgi:poly(3-hydroxybutyrate) depolymerase